MTRTAATIALCSALMAPCSALFLPSALAETERASADRRLVTHDNDEFAPPPAELPAAPRRQLPSATEAEHKIIAELLQRLHVSDLASRQVALSEIANVDESLLPAIQARLAKEAAAANRQGLKQLLLKLRDQARETLQKEQAAQGKKGEIETPDYLDLVVTFGDPEAELWPSLVNVLALSRMCLHLKTVTAVRLLVEVYVRFDFLRIDTQLQLKKLGDHALAALIESTKHPAEKIGDWARRQLDFLGKAIPGESVQVEDPKILADVLLAWGYVRDPDAARIVLSFANSERAQIRDAARQSVVLFGEVANWQLRDAYENMVGKRPPREWTWERTARELFSEFDRMRLAEVFTYYKQGLAALRANDLTAMRKAFDQVLARSADFEPREELVRGYLAYVDGFFDDPSVDVAGPLYRIQRLAPDEATRNKAESLLLTLRARQFSEGNVIDRSLLTRATELDSSNTRASTLLKDAEREPITERTAFQRVLWPAVLLLTAIAAAIAILWGRRRRAAG
jgi:hypothetical protein